MKIKGLAAVVATAAITSLGTLYLAGRYQASKLPYFGQAPSVNNLPVNYRFTDGSLKAAPTVDFQSAAEGSVKAAVHIKVTTRPRNVSAGSDPYEDMWGQLFGAPQGGYRMPQEGSGSGVVISQDGYIVTNNHVVANADIVTVTFADKSTVTAKVIGSDPTTDIAVVKVDRTNLPFMEFGNSDDVHLGQWVLAVGYPLSLDATVTAGIVSAKSRSIGINKTQMSRSQSSRAIESFIQTDAAVNPGNSGGPLVNTAGQLIGINSAIASATGYYSGYSYAVPANLVRKVVNDLIQYGSFQRAYMGVHYVDRSNLSPNLIDSLGLDRNPGVYVSAVNPKSGASVAGLKPGDFITAINGVTIQAEPELAEQIARYKPGDHVNVTYVRGGTARTASVTLQNSSGSTDVQRAGAPGKALGATLRTMTDDEKRDYETEGVVVTDPGTGMLGRQTSIKKGFIITSINKMEIASVDDAQAALAMSGGDDLQIAGFYPGGKGTYYFSIRGDGAGSGN